MSILRLDDPIFGGGVNAQSGLSWFAASTYPALGASGEFRWTAIDPFGWQPGIDPRAYLFHVTDPCAGGAWASCPQLGNYPEGYTASLSSRFESLDPFEYSPQYVYYIAYSAEPSWIAALPLLNAWSDSPLAQQVLRNSLHPAQWQAWFASFGTGESDYDYFSRVAESYNVAGAKTWQETAYDVWWLEGYRTQDGYPTSWIRQNTVWDFRAVVLNRFFNQPGVVAAHGFVNWAALGGITVGLLENDYALALQEFQAKIKADNRVNPAKLVAIGLVTGGAAMALAGPLIAAALSATQAVGSAAVVLTKAISAAVNLGVKEVFGEMQGDPDIMDKPASPEILAALAAQTPAETAAMALVVAERESFTLLSEAKQIALAGGDASEVYAAAQEQTLVAAELARLAGDDAVIVKLQGALGDTLRAIEDPSAYQSSLAAPAFATPDAISYSPLASPAAFSDGLSPAALTGSAQIMAPAQASFPWWLLLAVPVTMLAGKKGHTRRRAPSHNRKRSR